MNDKAKIEARVLNTRTEQDVLDYTKRDLHEDREISWNRKQKKKGMRNEGERNKIETSKNKERRRRESFGPVDASRQVSGRVDISGQFGDAGLDPSNARLYRLFAAGITVRFRSGSSSLRNGLAVRAGGDNVVGGSDPCPLLVRHLGRPFLSVLPDLRPSVVHRSRHRGDG